MPTIFPRPVRSISGIAAFALAVALQSAGAQPPKAPPPFAVRGMPGPGQAAMKALVGDWRVKMMLFAALGTPDKPAVSNDIRTHRTLIAGGRFLADETIGTMGGQPYYRRGTLGYSNMDKRYEWATQDGLNANMMIYLGAPGAGPGFPASLTGTFTDQGLLGEKSAGKTIRQRTVITVADKDHHRIEIYFTPAGGRERLIDRKDYTRIR
jgi:hypothetical protein